MKKVKIFDRSVVLNLTKKEYYILFDLLEERSFECSCDLESTRGIPVPKCERLYLQKCDLICKMAAQFRRLSDEMYTADLPCPFDDSSEG